MKDVFCEPKPSTPPKVLVGGSGEQVLMRIAAEHADCWNNMAVTQGQLEQKAAAFRQRCEDVGRDPAEVEISQQCTVVIAEDETTAKAALEKAHKVYGGHMGAGLEAHGIWGHPERVIDCIERHREHGVSFFIIEFFGRDTREPAQLFAESVMKHYAA